MSTRAFLALSVITACACAFGCGDDDDSSSSSGGTGGTGGTAASGGTGGSGGSGGTGATGGSSGSGGVSGADGGGGSAGSGGSSGSDAGSDADASGPASISITFTLDDTANKTYGAADGLAWKGSFSYDSSKNTIVHDGTWGGPFVPLWDDGPKSSGGHEAAGATAGDHIFTASVSYVADADRTFEYGAIRKSVNGSDGDWIWVGANGSFTVTKDSTTDVKLPVFAITAFGNVDLRLTIDTGALNSAFSTFNPSSGVKVKGSGWGWTEVAMGDAGTAGDSTANDGVFTFVLSQHIGAGKTLPHDGKLKTGSTAEFVFVLGGVEYKAGGAAATEGVGAATWGPGGTGWTNATVAVTTTTKNTYITVP